MNSEEARNDKVNRPGSKIRRSEWTREKELKLYDSLEVKRLMKSEKNEHLRGEYAKLASEQHIKTFSKASTRMVHDVDSMKREFPNFAELIELISSTLNLNLLSSSYQINLPPLLIVGPPGVGKTTFMHSLAEKLMCGFFMQDMSTTTSSFVLSGNAPNWADSRPGFVSNSMRSSRHANPLIMLDEIDKSPRRAEYDGFAPFYSLLEKQTAKYFRDEYLNVVFDCSWINWVATANEIDSIPPPVLSRFEVIQIEAPSKEQLSAIVESVFKSLLESNEWGLKFNRQLPEEIISQLQNDTPREIRKRLFKGCARAASRAQDNENIQLCSSDFDKPKTLKRGIGFLTGMEA